MADMGTKEAAENGVLHKLLFVNGVKKERSLLNLHRTKRGQLGIFRKMQFRQETQKLKITKGRQTL